MATHRLGDERGPTKDSQGRKCSREMSYLKTWTVRERSEPWE